MTTCKPNTMKLARTAILPVLLLIGFNITAQEARTKSVHSENTLPPKEQATSPQDAIAQLDKEQTGTSFVYSFVSNRLLTDDRAAQWETRFFEAFPLLEDIQIDSQTQAVTLKLPNSHTAQELREMIEKFGYTDFQVVN